MTREETFDRVIQDYQDYRKASPVQAYLLRHVHDMLRKVEPETEPKQLTILGFPMVVHKACEKPECPLCSGERVVVFGTEEP
jgi:hypothetical protein